MALGRELNNSGAGAGMALDETNRYGVLDVPSLQQAGGGDHDGEGEHVPLVLRGDGPEVGSGLAAPARAGEPVGAGAAVAVDVRALICEYDWPCAEALAVVYGPTPPNRDAPIGCPNGESGGDPWAVGGTSRGLFQVNGDAHAGRVGGDLDALFDPVTNVRVAYAIWRDNAGWGPWSCRP